MKRSSGQSISRRTSVSPILWKQGANKIDNIWLAPEIAELPEMPLFPPESVYNKGEESGEQMHAHPRSHGHLRPSIISLTFPGTQSQSGFFMCLKSGGAAIFILAKRRPKIIGWEMLFGIRLIGL